MQKGDIVTVNATVKGYSTKDDIEKVHLEIPSWNSKYTTDVKVSLEQKMAMPKGMTLTLELERENFQGNGQYQDREYGWYYGLLKIGDATTEPAPEAKAQNAAPALAGRSPQVSERERNESIVRQVAAKAATDIYIQGRMEKTDAERRTEPDEGMVYWDASGQIGVNGTEIWDAWFAHISYRILNIPHGEGTTTSFPVPPLVEQARVAGGWVTGIEEDE
jgi:hypothetical protein